MTISSKRGWINILDEATAANGAPASAADGTSAGSGIPVGGEWKTAVLRFRHSATGARTFTVKLWGYCRGETDASGAVVADTNGWVDLEETVSLSSTSTDGSFAKVYYGLNAFDRLYAEVTAVSGTSAKVSVAIGRVEE